MLIKACQVDVKWAKKSGGVKPSNFSYQFIIILNLLTIKTNQLPISFLAG